MGFGTVDEWTGTENDGLIVGSAHVGRGTMDGLHALVMAHLPISAATHLDAAIAAVTEQVCADNEVLYEDPS